MSETVEDRVNVAVDAWLRWVPGWVPGTHRGRARLCRRCTGSPILSAAGISNNVPHQVTHALVSRMQRIVDRRVDEFTAAKLPVLHAELSGEELWRAGEYDPVVGLDPEYEGLSPDPDPEDDGQPFLFTLAGFAEEAHSDPPLPRPPLSVEEKRRIAEEIELADHCATETGTTVCHALVAHRPRIEAAIRRFVEPQIRAMLDELSRHLEPPQ